MAQAPKRLSELVREVLDERISPDAEVSSARARARAEDLRTRLAEIESNEPSRRRLRRLTAKLPAERRRLLERVLATLELAVGDRPGASGILTEEPRDLLPLEGGAWRFVPAGLGLVGRGAVRFAGSVSAASRVESEARADRPRVTLAVDDTLGTSRLRCTIRSYPTRSSLPRLVLIPQGGGPDDCIEIEPEVAPDREAGDAFCFLRYAAALKPGRYWAILARYPAGSASRALSPASGT